MSAPRANLPQTNTGTDKRVVLEPNLESGAIPAQPRAIVPLTGEELGHRFIKVARFALDEFFDMDLKEAMKMVRSAYLVELLRVHDNNQCRAAKAAGVHRNTISRFVTEAGLSLNPRKNRRERN
jgi:DNA-binding protein Fis